MLINVNFFNVCKHKDWIVLLPIREYRTSTKIITHMLNEVADVNSLSADNCGRINSKLLIGLFAHRTYLSVEKACNFFVYILLPVKKYESLRFKNLK